MTIIKKLFIKDYQNTDNPKVRHKYGIVAGTIGICSNIFLSIIKIILGIISGSITIVIDAINNLSDAGVSIITLIGFKLSSKPADKDHPFGHAKYEYIIGLIISLFTFAIGVMFVKSCIEKIITPNDINIDILTYIILSIGIITKVFQFLIYRNFAKDIDSDALRASANDSRIDIITSITILTSMILMSALKINIDGYIGLLVSIYIIISACKQILDTINPLLSTKPDQKLIEKIKRHLHSFEEIKHFHDLIIHTYGSGVTFASVHVEVPHNTELLKIHELVDKVERHFEEKLDINLIIQIDPVDKENPRTKEIYEKTKKTIKSINKTLSIHSLRVIYNEDRIKVLFDITEDFSFNLKKTDITPILLKSFADEPEEFEFIFTIDKPII